MCFEQIEDDDYVDGQGLYNDVYGIKTKALEIYLDPFYFYSFLLIIYLNLYLINLINSFKYYEI